MRPSKNPPSDIAAISSRSKKGAIADGVGIESPAGARVSADGWDSRLTTGRRNQVLEEHQG